MNTMAEEAKQKLDTFSQQNLGNLCWGACKLSHLDTDLMDRIALAASSLSDQLTLQHITQLVYSCALVHYAPKNFMPAVLEEAKRRMEESGIKIQQLTNLLWSCAILEVRDRELWDACMGQLTTYEELQQEGLAQTFQALMLLRAEFPDETWPIDPRLESMARTAWISGTKDIT